MKRKDLCNHWEKGRKKSTSCGTLTHTAKRCCGTPSTAGFKEELRQMLITDGLDML